MPPLRGHHQLSAISPEIDAEVRKLRGEIRIATKEYRRIVDGISSKKSKDTKADFERLRTIKSETGIKYGRVKTLLLEKARLGKPQPRSVSIKFSTRSPKKCHAGQVCSHEVTVTNEGDALYAIAIPIIYQMSISLPALIAEADGLACAIDDRNITCLGDEIDIENGGEFTVPLKIGLSSGMRSQAFEGCARFPDLGQLRSGELTREGVRLLQLALIRTGIDLDSVDGDFGPATQNAVDVYAEVLGLPTQKGVSTEIIEALFPAPLFAKAPDGTSPEICVKTPVETIPRTTETQSSTIMDRRDRPAASQDRRGALVKRFAIDYLTGQLRGKKKRTARPAQRAERRRESSERRREPIETETQIPSGGEMMEIAPPENSFQFR